MDKNVHFNFKKALCRRTVLQGAGVSLGLPFLDAMCPVFSAESETRPKRFVGLSLALGLHGPNWIPEGEGTNYKPSRYLKSVQDLRKDFTVVSGSSHPGVTGGHTAEGSIFSACPNQRGATSRNTISLDQLMAKHYGHETRFPSLVLNAGSSTSPSYTENGSMIPAESNPEKVFAQLFRNDSASEKARQSVSLRRGRSIMDVVGAEAKALQRELGAGDREKLDAWFTSVNELENRLKENQNWVNRPKPKVDAKAPKADKNNLAIYERAMLDIIFLALQTDSTRIVTLHLPGNARFKDVEGVDEGYHTLSHHGRDEEKIDQLTIVEQAIIDEWGEFLRKLKASEQNGHTLLDETQVIMTSNLGNASSHDNRNMPVLFAGGGFQHGRHLAFNQKDNYPLPNLYLSTLQRMGLEMESFATSSGTMSGLV
ncbi:MAG: DUF1552 domain-containing protein [Verrucomicrobiales bacterium]|nr:DUF1552 domain-containing protein [Verrucomicrobiales bacterium]